eukprot:INCI4398.1.p1 GENE.INCI4398.1~~INCI4398.1.p1  ORF type:complete len:151 (+),score=0.83 INCI4398.1:137-589(+)
MHSWVTFCRRLPGGRSLRSPYRSLTYWVSCVFSSFNLERNFSFFVCSSFSILLCTSASGAVSSIALLRSRSLISQPQGHHHTHALLSSQELPRSVPHSVSVPLFSPSFRLITLTAFGSSVALRDGESAGTRKHTREEKKKKKKALATTTY